MKFSPVSFAFGRAGLDDRSDAGTFSNAWAKERVGLRCFPGGRVGRNRFSGLPAVVVASPVRMSMIFCA